MAHGSREFARRGSAAIEFAIWLPVVLMFVATVVDYGFYMTRRVAVARATMEGARYGAAVFEPDSVPEGTDVEPAARDRASEMLTDMGIACPVVPSCAINTTYCQSDASAACNNPPFDAIQVEIDYTYTPIFGLVPVPTHIQEKQIMAVEHQRG